MSGTVLYPFARLRRVALGTLLAAAAVTCVDAADFVGQNTGAIPDNNAAGRDVTFTVSGLAGGINEVRLSLGLQHTFIGDLEVVLISPGGLAQLVVMGRAGNNRGAGSGIQSNLDGIYEFGDAAAGDLWAAIVGPDTNFVLPPGKYRSTTAGRVGLSDIGGCSTHLNRAFSRLSGAQANGVWTLHVADRAGADTGAINGATLSIEASDALFAGGFEEGEPDTPAPAVSDTRGRCKETFYDFTGTGLSSYTTVQNTGGGPEGEITWSVRENDGTVSGALQSFVLGDASNVFIDGDFDGDGIRDATVWRAQTGIFTVRRSSRPNDVPLRLQLGQIGDDATHIGDYDGDNVSDLAVYRAGAAGGDPSFTLIRLSRDGSERSIETGENGHFPSGGLDYNLDTLADMAIQSNAGGGTARFRLFDGGTGAMFGEFIFGTPTDVIVTGNHVGDRVGDTTVARGVGGNIEWKTRDGSTAVESAAVLVGLSATDFLLGGDYDGDGLDDYAVWRPSAIPDASKFIVRRSSTPAPLLEVPGGQNGHYPVASSRKH